MRKGTEEAWKKCPKCGKIENQVKAGYNASGSQRCKCKECGIYYTIDPKRHAYPEETRELAIKMYYGGISGRGVGKILGINKSNVMNWIKKDQSWEKWNNIPSGCEYCGIRWALLVLGIQIPDRNPGKHLHYDHGEPKAAANRGTYCKPEQIIQDNSEDGWCSSWGRVLLYRWISGVSGRNLSRKAYLQHPQ